MSPYRSLIMALWTIFLAYWAVSAIGVKRNAPYSWRGGIGLRLILIFGVVALAQSPTIREFLIETQRQIGRSATVGWIGAALCLSGFGLAIAARRHLGRNWGMPMSQKEDAQLVTSGPYAFIRHPIYTGLILAMLGSAIAINIFWLLLTIVIGAYFIFSARREEATMLQQFPEAYAAYQARTGMLFPPLRRH